MPKRLVQAPPRRKAQTIELSDCHDRKFRLAIEVSPTILCANSTVDDDSHVYVHSSGRIYVGALPAAPVLSRRVYRLSRGPRIAAGLRGHDAGWHCECKHTSVAARNDRRGIYAIYKGWHGARGVPGSAHRSGRGTVSFATNRLARKSVRSEAGLTIGRECVRWRLPVRLRRGHGIQQRIAGDDHIGRRVTVRAASWRRRCSDEPAEAGEQAGLTGSINRRTMIAGANHWPRRSRRSGVLTPWRVTQDTCRSISVFMHGTIASAPAPVRERLPTRWTFMFGEPLGGSSDASR